MAYPTKIVTCCYCGARAALVLRGKDRHELACSSCGAPLHDLKMLPKDRVGDRELVDRPQHMGFAPKKAKKRSKPPVRKRKKRKGLWHKIAEEAWDVLEDIFD